MDTLNTKLPENSKSKDLRLRTPKKELLSSNPKADYLDFPKTLNLKHYTVRKLARDVEKLCPKTTIDAGAPLGLTALGFRVWASGFQGLGYLNDYLYYVGGSLLQL